MAALVVALPKNCLIIVAAFTTFNSISTTTALASPSSIRAFKSIESRSHIFHKSTSSSTRIFIQQGLHSYATESKNMLRQYTVKQLKEKIKDLNLPIKTSHLKLKNDLVDFLHEQYNQYNTISNNGDQNNHSIEENQSKNIKQADGDNSVNGSSTLSSRPILQTLRQLDTSIEQSPPAPTPQLTKPRDIIFEHVFNRYPPLRDLQSLIQSREDSETSTDTTVPINQFQSILTHNPQVMKSLSGLGEMDVRQKYHPMLKDMTSSDLDIVTVGTASCVPGVTRGVSCTALRLQWRRNTNNKREGNSSNSSQDGSNGGSSGGASTGGIWIFDCGESTQVCLIFTYHICFLNCEKILHVLVMTNHDAGTRQRRNPMAMLILSFYIRKLET